MKLNPYNKAQINGMIFGKGGCCSKEAEISPLITPYEYHYDPEREEKTQENIRGNKKKKEKEEKKEKEMEEYKNVIVTLDDIRKHKGGKGIGNSRIAIEDENSTPPPSPKEKSPKEIKEECMKKLRQVAEEVKEVRRNKQDYTEKVFEEIERVRKILNERHEFIDTHNVKNDYIEKTNSYIYRFIELINTQR